ncbi:aldehyde dehydrogenase family protein [Microbacterium sp. MAHUQ-60]|uniref:aldehyde dehydrogenase family protein n=1 Tax=unclassified Microbacterium TaxID=2609290 RepID=UPI00361F32A2
MTIAIINPADGALIREYAAHTDAEVETRIAAAHAAHLTLRDTAGPTRADWMRRAADLIETEAERVAATITQEMGKTLAQSRAEVRKSAHAMRFYADHSAEFLADSPLRDPASVGASAAYTTYQPLGVVLAVMPWNYPIWQVIRFAAPALMAGNTGLLKHASNVPASAMYLDDLFERAGFPVGSFRTLLIPATRVEPVLRDPRVRAVTLTGSEPAGRAVAAIAGSEVKPVVLELGGSDPFLVMPSADIDRAVATAVTARTANNGQACINAKRFIVHAEVHEEFLDKFTAAMGGLSVGDPTDLDTDVGPLASAQAREDLHALVDDALGRGAVATTGGRVPDGAGWYYPPTVLTGITPQMRLYGEEAFGPVATVYRVDDAQHALRIANDTSFGLSSAVWSGDAQEQDRLVSGLQAGAVFVNGMSASHPALPFGGIKDSGVGRELSAEGIRAFCNLKTVWRG